jgi:putative two-component system response regulator
MKSLPSRRWNGFRDSDRQAVTGAPWAQMTAPEIVALEETEAILFALAVAVEQRDRQTAGHCERLALISLSLGIALGLARAELIALYRGGFLHDVG